MWHIVEGSEKWAPWQFSEVQQGLSLDCVIEDEDGRQTDYSFSGPDWDVHDPTEPVTEDMVREGLLEDANNPARASLIERRFVSQVAEKPASMPQPVTGTAPRPHRRRPPRKPVSK